MDMGDRRALGHAPTRRRIASWWIPARRSVASARMSARSCACRAASCPIESARSSADIIGGEIGVTPDYMTAAQIKAAQELTAYVEAAVHRPVGQWCHRDVRSQVWPAIASPGKWTTSCPGDLIYARCHDGQFRPADPPPTPPEPITEDDVQIRYRDKRYYNIWLVGAAPALNLSGQLDAYFATKGIELVEGEHDQMLRGLLVQSGLTTADLVPR